MVASGETRYSMDISAAASSSSRYAHLATLVPDQGEVRVARYSSQGSKTLQVDIPASDLANAESRVTAVRVVAGDQGKCACYYGTSDGLCGRVSVSGGKKHTADWRTDAGAGANVSAIFFDDRGEDDPAVFGALSNGTIVQLGAIKGNQIETYLALDSASEQSIDGLAVLEDNKYAYVNLGNEVKLVSLAKEKAISTLVPSHQLGVDTVCACLGEKYVLGIGGGSMDVWKVNRRPAAKPVSPAASTPLPLPEAKVRAVGMDRSGSIVGMALDGDGTTKVYLYRLSFKQMKTQCKDESTLLATIDCGAAAVTSLGFAPEGGSVALALESAPGGPNFQVLSFDSETGGQTLALPSTEAAEGDGAQTSGKAKKRKQPEKEQQANGSKDAQQQQQAEPESIEDDTPLEVRVSQMDIGAKSGANPTQQQPVAVAQAAGANSIKPKQLNADSAVVLLSQALQSNDKELLEQCLQIRQEQVISNTVKQLRSDQVGTLIPLLVDRINSSSTRAMQVACWIRHVVRHHLTYIISAPSMKDHLGVLYQRLEERRSAHEALLGLHGRLDLLTTYIKTARRQRSGEGQDKGALNGGDYYGDPSIVRVHERDGMDENGGSLGVETISFVPQIANDEDVAMEGDEDEEMVDAK